MPRQRIQISDLLIRDSKNRNPFAVTPDQGTLTNFAPVYGKLIRVPFAPPFVSSSSSSRVWHIVDFQFQRDSARNQQILIFKADGKVYKRQAGMETEIFPAASGFAAFVQKPSVVNLADRLHVSDGSQYLIYDGWSWCAGGLTAPAAPSCSLVASGSLTGTYKIAVSAAVLRNGVQIHESSRSATTTNAPSAQNIRVTQPTLDSRATHWNVYMSELSGSDVYRRAATIAVTSTTTDISAVPTSTAATAPIRNDKPQPSRVLGGWKNRIAMRDETSKSNLWFTAFAEVKGLLNGAPEESVPGRGSSSISDLANNWTLPDSGEPIQNAIWHNEYLWVFSDRNGYMIRGEGSLLDSTGIRDFFPQHLFTYGAASPWSTNSTPYGLVTMTPDKKLWLFSSAARVYGQADAFRIEDGESVDIGRDIQDYLNALSDTQLSEMELGYWEGGGNAYLFVPLADRLAVLDFSTVTQDSPHGVWFDIQTGVVPTCVGQVSTDGNNFLLLGQNDGSVVQLDNSQSKGFSVFQPAHLGLSMKLGSTYLGSTVQNAPTATARTGSLPADKQGAWSEGHFIELFHIGTGDTDTTGVRPSAPAVNVYYDDLNPNGPANAIGLTPAAVAKTSEKRAWLKQSASASAAGAVAKRFQFEVQFSNTTTDGASRPQCVNDEGWQVAFSWTPLSDLRL